MAFVGVRPGQRLLDVGCGTGALIGALIDVLGSVDVVGIDPSAVFVAAVQERHPGVRVEHAGAENLPFADATFEGALAQLSIDAMLDPARGVREMVRVTEPGGVVAACVWDHAGGHGPLSVFWEAAGQDDPDVLGEAHLPGAGEGQLALLWGAAGLESIEITALTVGLEIDDFDTWWDSFIMGSVAAGTYLAAQTPERRRVLRERCQSMQPPGTFVVAASAWAVRGVVPRSSSTD